MEALRLGGRRNSLSSHGAQLRLHSTDTAACLCRCTQHPLWRWHQQHAAGGGRRTFNRQLSSHPVSWNRLTTTTVRRYLRAMCRLHCDPLSRHARCLLHLAVLQTVCGIRALPVRHSHARSGQIHCNLIAGEKISDWWLPHDTSLCLRAVGATLVSIVPFEQAVDMR